MPDLRPNYIVWCFSISHNQIWSVQHISINLKGQCNSSQSKVSRDFLIFQPWGRLLKSKELDVFKVLVFQMPCSHSPENRSISDLVICTELWNTHPVFINCISSHIPNPQVGGYLHWTVAHKSCISQLYLTPVFLTYSKCTVGGLFALNWGGAPILRLLHRKCVAWECSGNLPVRSAVLVPLHPVLPLLLPVQWQCLFAVP